MDKQNKQSSVTPRRGGSRVSSASSAGKQSSSVRQYAGLGARAASPAQRKRSGASAGISDSWTQSNALGAALGTGNALGGLAPGANKENPEQNVGGGGGSGSSHSGGGNTGGASTGGAKNATTPVSITASDTSAASWRDHGAFWWEVGFATTGRSGWLVQEITNTFAGTDSGGNALTMTGVGIVPHYYEAWAVDAAGAITPSAGATHDMWGRVGHGTGSKGNWSMRGAVFWTTTDPATQGMTPGGVSNAGILLSSTSAPAGLGTARLHRYANGTWDSTGATPVHTGSAA